MGNLDKKVLRAILDSYGIQGYEEIVLGVISSHFRYCGKNNKDLLKSLNKIIKDTEK